MLMIVALSMCAATVRASHVPMSLDVFNVVDVFSIISELEDMDVDVTGAPSARAAALDYVLDFGNSVTGASSPGVAVKVFVPDRLRVPEPFMTNPPLPLICPA